MHREGGRLTAAWSGCWVGGAADQVRLGTVVPGKWHKVALGFDGGEDGTLAPWLTGWFDDVKPAGSPRVISHTILNSRGAASLGVAVGALPLTHSGLGGASEPVSGKGFVGRIDDLNVFNRALYDINVSMLGDRLYQFDADDDGVIDSEDAFPQDGSETLDADGDGTGNNADPDDDNDGMSDADEIMAGTIPTDPSSIFAISAFDTDATQSMIHWASISGRTYFVEYSDDLAAWQRLPGAENVLAEDAETNMVDTNDTMDTRFYRVVVQPE